MSEDRTDSIDTGVDLGNRWLRIVWSEGPHFSLNWLWSFNRLRHHRGPFLRSRLFSRYEGLIFMMRPKRHRRKEWDVSGFWELGVGCFKGRRPGSWHPA